MTDIESIRLQIAMRLPVRVHWSVNDTPLDFDFSRSQAPLRQIADTDIVGRIEEEWKSLRVFGEEDYAEGGGASSYLGVHWDTGEVFGLDVERHSAQMFLLNSDVDRFIQTFLTLDQTFRFGTIPSQQVVDRLREIDPHGFETSEWRLLTNCNTQ